MFSRNSFSNAPWNSGKPSQFHPGSPGYQQSIATVQPSSVSVTVSLEPSPAPAEASPPPMFAPKVERDTNPKPILHGYTSASEKAPKRIDNWVCVKDQEVIRNSAMNGLRKSIATNISGIVLKRELPDPVRLATSLVMGYQTGKYMGELKAAEMCMPSLPPPQCVDNNTDRTTYGAICNSSSQNQAAANKKIGFF